MGAGGIFPRPFTMGTRRGVVEAVAKEEEKEKGEATTALERRPMERVTRRLE